MKKSNKKYIFYAFIGIAILGIAFWGFNYLKGRQIFSANTTYYVYYERVDGLQVSNPISINGFNIGKVKEIALVPEENCKLKVTLNINKQYKIPSGTIARIESTDLLGSKSIVLDFNDSATTFLTSGDTLPGIIEFSLKDQVSFQMIPVKNKAEELMSEMSNVMEIIQNIFNEDNSTELKKSIRKLTSAIALLENSMKNVDTLLVNNTPKVTNIISHIEELTETIRNNKGEIDRIVKNFSQISDTLTKLNISQTINKMNSTLADVDSIINKINTGNGSISELINNDKLIRELENTVESMNKLINDVKTNPKKYVHFSLIDRGKTINVVDTSRNEK